MLFLVGAAGRRCALQFPRDGVAVLSLHRLSLRWYREVLRLGFVPGGNVRIRLSSHDCRALDAGARLHGGLWALPRTSSRWQLPLALLFFLPITLPGLFLGLALLVFFARIDLKLSLVTVTVGHLIYVFPYFLLIVKAALDRMDPALEEAAADLGAGSVVRSSAG